MNQKDIIDKLTEALRDLLDEAPPGTIDEDALWTEPPGMFNHLPAARAALAEYDAQRQTLAPSQAGAVAAVLADALGCFWNAAIGADPARHDPTALATVSAVAMGLEAVASRLREHADDAPPAAVPVEALKALVAGWRIDGVVSDKYADELTQLIKERSNG